MKPKIILILPALLLVPFAVHAGSDLSQLSKMTQPGEWAVTTTTKMQMTGTSAALPARTMTRKECVTQKDLDKLKNFTAPKIKGMTCKMLHKDLSGNTLTFSMQCTGKQGDMQLDGSSVFASKTAYKTHLEMKGTMQNMPMTIIVDADSKRIGDCTDQPPKS